MLLVFHSFIDDICYAVALWRNFKVTEKSSASPRCKVNYLGIYHTCRYAIEHGPQTHIRHF